MGQLRMLCMGLLVVFGRAQELRNCSVETSHLTVDSTEAAATLAASLDCSNGDFEVEWVGEVFVTDTIHVTNGTSLSITGAGSGGIADGGNVTQLFVVDRGSTLRFSDMTLAHGNASSGGAINAFEASVSFSGSISFISNSAVDDGGAIFAGSLSSIFWIGDGTQFISNSAGGSGGAIYVDNNSPITWYGDDTLFISNSAGGSGGAIFVDFFSTIAWYGDDTQFISNSAGDYGGAMSVDTLYWRGDGTLFSSNSAGSGGGAIDGEVLWEGDGIRFISNSAGRDGGAIYGFSSIVSWNGDGTEFISNSASDNGGAISISSVSWNGNGTTFVSNSAGVDGGGIDGEVTWYGDGIVFSSNSAGNDGGAIFLSSNNNAFWDGNATFIRNVAGESGGAIASVENDVMTMIYGGTFIENRARNGGALYFGFATGFNISDAAFESNSANSGGAVAAYTTGYLPATGFTRCNFSDNVSETGGAVETLAANVVFKSCAFEGNMADVGGALRLDGATVIHGCSFLSNAALTRGLAVAVEALDGSTNISTSSFEGNELFCAAGSYRKDTEKPEEERSAGCFHRKIIRAIPLQALKIVVVVWQILIQFADAAQVTYPGAYQDFLSAIDVVNFDLGSVLSAGCLWSNMDFHDRLLVNTLGPLVVVGLLGITYLIAMYRSSAAGSDAVVDKIRYRHQTVLLLVTFLIYSSVSSTVFQTFACEKLDDGGDYLRADYNIQCTDAKHKSFEVYAGIMIFVYPVGIPLLYAILLFQRRDVLANAGADKTRAQSIVGLWEPYRPERFYYEVVECGRRIMLTGVVVFIFPNDAAQLAITMLLAFVFFMVFEMMRPYEAESDMWLSRGGHMTVFLGMYYLLLQKVDVSGERGESQDIYGGLLVSCHVLMVLAILVEVIGICYASRGNHKEVAEGTPSSSGNLSKPGVAGLEEAPYFESIPPP
eukprot:g4823.t1